MKFSKKLIASVLVMVMLVTTSTDVLAERSYTTNVTVIAEQIAEYIIDYAIEKTEDYLKLLEEVPEVVEIIDQVNAAKDKMKTFAELLAEYIEKLEDGEAKTSAEEVAEAIKGKEFITPFFDLIPVGDVKKNSNNNYEVTMNVPALTEDTTGVLILHYSDERMLWEVIEPLNVDLEKKTITVEFKDLSPVAIIADKGTAASTDNQSQGTSPKTQETSSDWKMWLGTAVVLLSAGTVMVCRKKKCQ